MIWFILFIIACVVAAYIAYKKGEVHELHKTRAAFKHYLEAHQALKDVLGPGLEAAEHIIDRLEEGDSIW